PTTAVYHVALLSQTPPPPRSSLFPYTTLFRSGRDRQRGERLGHDERQLDLVVEGQRLGADDVDVGLGELAEASLLGAFPAPDLLDLVALEREDELAGVLQDVARQRHGEVEVEPEPALLGAVLLALEAADDVDLLGGLPLAEQLLDGLHRPRLDAGEAVQLEGAAQRVQDVRLDGAFGGQPLREAGQGGRSCHGRDPMRGGAQPWTRAR